MGITGNLHMSWSVNDLPPLRDVAAILGEGEVAFGEKLHIPRFMASPSTNRVRLKRLLNYISDPESPYIPLRDPQSPGVPLWELVKAMPSAEYISVITHSQAAERTNSLKAQWVEAQMAADATITQNAILQHLSLGIGPHVVHEVSSDADDGLGPMAFCNFSVSFWEKGVPADSRRCKELYIGMKPFVLMRSRLESLMGSARVFCSWS